MAIHLNFETEGMSMHRAAAAPRLLAGLDPSRGFEPLDGHRRRLGSLPAGGDWLIDELQRSGLRGHGGAWFPTGRKWAAVAGRSHGRAVLVVNASEGEPLSAKDRTLMALRPHLVLDGAVAGAQSVGASEVVIYLSHGMGAAARAVRRALGERRRARLAEPPMRVVSSPHRYLSGESSAVVQRVEGGPAVPRMTPPHISEAGVGGRPTLVQNAETLAHAALVARFGSEEFRRLGTAGMPGTTLLTVSGNVRRPGVYEVELGSRIGDVLKTAGGVAGLTPGALLGGYFGAWVAGDELFERRLDTGLGCGVLAVLPEGACGIEESARILDYLSAESAGQCGPCVNGLQAIAVTMQRIARSAGDPEDLPRLRRWSGLVRGRGACRHPDGAAGHLESTLAVFADHLDEHLAGAPCRGRWVGGFPRPPARFRWWR